MWVQRYLSRDELSGCVEQRGVIWLCRAEISYLVQDTDQISYMSIGTDLSSCLVNPNEIMNYLVERIW